MGAKVMGSGNLSFDGEGNKEFTCFLKILKNFLA